METQKHQALTMKLDLMSQYLKTIAKLSRQVTLCARPRLAYLILVEILVNL